MPRVRLLTNFYVTDVETGIDVKYSDIETREVKTGVQWGLWPFKETFKFAVIYGHNYTKVCNTHKEWVDTFKEKRFQGRIVFAHNGGRFDYMCLFGNILQACPEAIFNGSRFISCKVGKCTFADSTNIFVGQSVKTIGKQLGIEKQVLGDELFSPNGVTATEVNYCTQDCRIIYEALIRSFEFAGDIKITQASLSMTYFRRTHQEFNIYHNEAARFFWDSYYGGRCEAFKIGNTNAMVYDVNSMYPAVMKVTQFPNPKFLKILTDITPNEFLKHYLYNYEGLVYADVYHRDFWTGLLPIRKKNKLLFPIGNLQGCWNFNEFRYAYESGKIEVQNIKRIVYARPMPSPFVGYINRLFGLKLKAEQDGDEFMRDLYKRYANSLYGKFAQRIDEEKIYIEDVNKQYHIIQKAIENKTFKKLEMFNAERIDCYLVLSTKKASNISYSIPSFASYITSAARVILTKAMVEAKARGNKPVYCDTDSQAVENIIGMPESSALLGEWKLEDKIIFEIRGCKNYKFLKAGKKYRRLKGVPDKAQQIQDNIYRYFNLMGSKESIRRNMNPGTFTKRIKKISGKYDKRIVLPDGETTPIIL